MGNDGGSIPTRRELVKEAARHPTSSELKESIQEQQEHSWSIDPLSHQPLAAPVVSDCLGRLFNKESIIEYLLPADEEAGRAREDQTLFLAGTIKSLKDVVELKFEVDQANVDQSRKAKSLAGRTEKWICPVTNKELGASVRAAYIVPCGHAFSETALKEVSEGKCLQCNESYAPNDVIPIFPTAEIELTRLRLRIESLQEKGLSHALKKASGSKKKRKKGEAERGVPEDEKLAAPNDNPQEALASGSLISKSEKTSGAKVSGIKNASTASLTAKVLEEQQQRQKRQKLQQNDNIQSLFSKGDGKSGAKKGRDIDFMNRGFAIPNK